MPLTKIGSLVALSFFATFSILALDSEVKVEHDSGIYIALGQSLVTGQGYSTIFLAGHPPHTKYPPVFPAFLAPLIGLIGFHVLAMKLLMVALALLTLYLLYVFVTDLAGDLMAFLVVTFTATSHGMLFYAQSIMTEIPYLCFSLLALLWVHRCSRRKVWSGKAVAIAVALISLTYLTRLIGLSLLLAIVVYLVCDSPGRPEVKIRRAIAMGGSAALPALIWFSRNWWVGESGGTAYASDFHLQTVYAAPSVIDGIVTFFAGVGTNPAEYALHTARVVFFYYPWVSRTVLPLLLAALTFGGFLWCAVRQRTLLEYYMFFYMCMLLLLPVDHPQRYIVPLIPFIWYYVLTGAGHLLAWLRSQVLMRQPGHQRGVVIATVLLALSLLIANVTMAVRANIIDRGRDGYYHVVGEDRYVSIVPWVRAYTSPQSVFMWAKPSLRFLRTERKAVDYPRTHNTEDVLHAIHWAARRLCGGRCLFQHDSATPPSRRTEISRVLQPGVQGRCERRVPSCHTRPQRQTACRWIAFSRVIERQAIHRAIRPRLRNLTDAYFHHRPRV